jgi:predicted CopG family antitoxin
MSHQITITVSDEVYQGLRTVAGGRTISELIEELARPIVTESGLEASYQDMALDDEREREATEWIEGLVQDSLPSGPHAPR